MTTPQDQQSRELLPCPFCGNPLPYVDDAGQVYVVECGSCGGRGTISADYARAVADWNRRAPAVQPARALPAGIEPAASVNTMEVMGGREVSLISLRQPLPAGTKLYTAAQVLAMGRVPPGGQPEPVAGQCRFVGEAAWAGCTAEHVRMVLAAPQEWKGYEVRYLYAETPPPPAAQDELEIEQTRREAESLAWSLFNRHYAKGEDYTSGRSVFGLCDSLRGVLSQIDNMTTGLVRDPAAQERKPLTDVQISELQTIPLFQGVPHDVFRWVVQRIEFEHRIGDAMGLEHAGVPRCSERSPEIK